MSRSRDPRRTRGILLAAAGRILDRHYVSTDKDRIVLPVAVTEIVNETALLSEDGSQALSQGSIKSSFGGKAEFLRAAAVDYIRDLGTPPPHAIAAKSAGPVEFCVSQVQNRLVRISWSRHWMALHAHASDSHIAEAIYDIFAQGEDQLTQVCKAAGTATNRRPVDGEDWESISTALSTWLEGVIVRLAWARNAMPATERSTLNDQESLLIRQGFDLLWSGLTVASPPSGGRDPEDQPREDDEFTASLDSLDVEWFVLNQLDAVRGSLKPRSATLEIPWLRKFGLGETVQVRARVNVESNTNLGTATVVLIIDDEGQSASGDVLATIVSADGSEKSQRIQSGFAEIEDVVVSGSSPGDLKLRLTAPR